MPLDGAARAPGRGQVDRRPRGAATCALAPLDTKLTPPAKVRRTDHGHSHLMTHSALTHSSLSLTRTSLVAASALCLLLVAQGASAQASDDSHAEPAVPAVAETHAPRPYRLGAHAELDVGALIFLRQGAAFAGGVVYGPFRAGLSYASFLSNPSFGGTPDGFSLRANYIVGINASYFIAQSTDEGLYVQAMFHIKQQGVTNEATGDHRDLNSLAAGLELGYVWKLYRGLYVAPRVGALYYLKKPQGAGNRPLRIGDRDYDNGRHKDFDTYFIPTVSVGYSW